MSKKKELQGLIVGLVAIIVTAIFIMLGFLMGRWNIAWLVFLAIPITSIVMDIFSKGADKSGAIVGFVALLCTGVFFIIGFWQNLWHPGWLVFLVIPIVAIIIDIVKRKDIPGSIVGLVAVLAAVLFFILGFFFGVWSIAWIVFLAIPITAIIQNIIKVVKSDSTEQSVE